MFRMICAAVLIGVIAGSALGVTVSATGTGSYSVISVGPNTYDVFVSADDPNADTIFPSAVRAPTT